MDREPIEAKRWSLPASPDLTVVLCQTDSVIAGLSGFRCYPTGCEMALSVRIRPGVFAGGLIGDTFDPRHRGASTDAEHFDLHVRYENGATTSVVNQVRHPRPPTDVHGPRIKLIGGSAASVRSDYYYWLDPLPEGHTIWFGCVWPRAGIELNWTAADAAAIRSAGNRALAGPWETNI